MTQRLQDVGFLVSFHPLKWKLGYYMDFCCGFAYITAGPVTISLYF